jgi:L-histidine N-alpha-methyltransferase
MTRRPHATASGIDQRGLAADVQYALQLSPRCLPSRYFYDSLGSALFESICELPWYGVTRAERRLLHLHRDELFRRTGPLSTILELGSGSGQKLHTLAKSPLRRGRQAAHLVDVSAAALADAVRTLDDVDDLTVITHEAEYGIGLARFGGMSHGPDPSLALFLGSNLGNFGPADAAELLRHVRAALQSGDWFAVGVDLVKPAHRLLLAYDDPLGVTAAFNRNILVHLNRELDGDFDLAGFAHRAIWNAEQTRVEMHLVSTRRQRVRLAGAEVDVWLEEGESIWTESSYKYEPAGIIRMVEAAGFHCEAQWIDDPDRFALTLVRAV